jgi:hypothetical protein
VLNRTRILGLGLLLPLALAACQKTDKVAAVDPLANPAAVTQERLLKGPMIRPSGPMLVAAANSASVR